MSISSYTTVTMLDSRPSPITITMPKTTDIVNRIITFKDLYGSASDSTITLVTRSGDTFEDGTFSTIISNAYQTVNLYAGQPGKWLNIDGGSGGSSAGLTTISNLLNSVSTNVTSVSTNVATVSNLLNSVSTNVTSVSTNVATVSNLLNSVSTNATSISTNVATVSNLLNSVSTNATSISTNLATVSNTVAAGRFTGISTNTISTNLIIAGYVSSPQGYISSLIVDALSFSFSNSFISMGDIITTSVSTIQTFTSTLTTNNLRVGTVSSLNYIAFSGLQQGYNQTVIAEQSTGTGIQELLFFKGSTATDRIRMQTTGTIVFEPGVSARVFSATPSNATPAMIITTGSNVGIGVAAPTVALDVAGAGRFTAVSTNTISTSQVNSSNICNAGFISNNGIFSNTTAGAFFQNTSNTGTLGVAGIATLAAVTVTALSNSGNFSNAGFISNNGIFSNTTAGAFFQNTSNTGTLGVGGIATLAGVTLTSLSNSGNFSNAGFISNNGIFSNTTAGAFFQNTSNTGTLGVAGTAIFASNITQTAGGAYISNAGNLSNGGSATFFSNGFTAASPSTTNAYPYASFKINNASTNTLTPVVPLLLMTGNYGGSIAGGLTQGVGAVLTLGTISDGGATQEGYRLTGSNSAFYGNVDMRSNTMSNIQDLYFANGAQVLARTNGNTDLYGKGAGYYFTFQNGNSYFAHMPNQDVNIITANNMNLNASNAIYISSGTSAINLSGNLDLNNKNITNVNFTRPAAVSTNTVSTGIVNAGYLVGLLPGNTATTSVSPLAVGNGNGYLSFSPQIEFQYYSGGGYKHFMGSRHNGSATNSFGNAIDFWLYSATGGAGASTTPGTCNVNTLSVTAAGVGIFNNSPSLALDVAGAGRFTAVSTNTISTNNLYANQIYGATGIIYINHSVYYLGNGIDMGGGNINQVGAYYNTVTDINMTAVAGYSINHTGSNINLNASSINMRGTSNTKVQIGPRQYQGTAADTTTYGLERSRHEIQFAGYRDSQIDKIGSKIVNINKQTYGGGNQQLIQSADLAFFTVPPQTNDIDNTVERMRITDSGTVGIGVTAPTVTLDVAGAGRFTALSTNSISTSTLTVGGSALSARLGIQSNATTLTSPASVIITIPNMSYFFADYTNLTNYITISNYGAQNGDYINIVNTGNSGTPATFQILDGSTGVSTNIRYIYPGHAGVVAYSGSQWWPM